MRNNIDSVLGKQFYFILHIYGEEHLFVGTLVFVLYAQNLNMLCSSRGHFGLKLDMVGYAQLPTAKRGFVKFEVRSLVYTVLALHYPRLTLISK